MRRFSTKPQVAATLLAFASVLTLAACTLSTDNTRTFHADISPTVIEHASQVAWHRPTNRIAYQIKTPDGNALN